VHARIPARTPAGAIAREAFGPDDGRMSFLWGVVALLLLIVWALSVYDIVRRRLGGKRTVAWILIVVILPVIGSILYWWLRKPEPGDAQHKYEADRSRREEAQRRVF
jgi:hypothetical protein